MLDGSFIEIIVALVMSIAIAMIVMVSVASARRKYRLREQYELRATALRHHRA